MIHPDRLRQQFFSFFKKRNHAIIESGSLLPSSDDPTVLFTTAGMQPLVPYFMGAKHEKGNRLCDIQKSFRANDVEEVGDDTHHTFFEMMGNWSMGDYFKEEAIDLAYDFLVDELKMDPKRFAITIYEGDAVAPKDIEAKQLWLQKEGIEAAQIFAFDAKDNFWGPAGKTGPCGPCSEIHYDRGEKYGENLGPNTDKNQRFVEIWNLVFMEYNKKDDGSLEQLSQKNVDTGVGFERLLAILNAKDSAFDTPLFADILMEIEMLSGKKYATNKRVFRIIADHLRAANFCVSDGVLPGNEGRGYVLRSIIRRAVRSGRHLGISRLFTRFVGEVVMAQYGKYYPDLLENKKTIGTIIENEEKNFLKTLDKGEAILLEKKKDFGEKIDGKTVFRLFDTFGFPLDLTKDFAVEHDLLVDEVGFETEMKKQRERSRAASGEKFDRGIASAAFMKTAPTIFVGDSDALFGMPSEITATVLTLFEEKGEFFLACDQSPFYAEGGGQVGDTGKIIGNTGTMIVLETKKNAKGVFLHRGKVSGHIGIGETVKMEIDRTRRARITRHHSLAHLFLAAAKIILVDDLRQAGSHVNEHRMRLDFTFGRALREEEKTAIELLVAKEVEQSRNILLVEKDIETAKAEGAEATFGEKYGDTVRTVKMGDFSYELCGGTHVRNTAEIGAVKILTESGVSAGVRRVEMVCGMAAQTLLQQQSKKIDILADLLKVHSSGMEKRITTLFAENREQKMALGVVQKKLAAFVAKTEADTFFDHAGKKCVVTSGEDPKLAGALAREVIKEGVDEVIVICKTGNIVVATSGKTSAKALLQILSAEFGGGGGGGEYFATGGGAQNISIENVRLFLHG